MNNYFKMLVAYRMGAYRVEYPGNPPAPMEPARTVDTQEQVDHCLNCPYPECRMSGNCTFRLTGKEKQHIPKGYDQKTMDKAMAKVYTIADLSNLLGIKKWLANEYMNYYFERKQNEQS